MNNNMKKKVKEPDFKQALKEALTPDYEGLIIDLELSEDKEKILRNYMVNLKDDIDVEIDNYDFPAEELMQQDMFIENFLDTLKYNTTPEVIKKHNQAIIDIIELRGPYKVIHCPSLAEEIKTDEFINELKLNPYQLKLIS